MLFFIGLFFMRILLLSAYNTDSHKAWCQGLIAHLPQHEWCYLTLPGRFFSWRIRGNPVSFALGEHSETLTQSFDLILATSMVDLATLKGLRPNLAATPSIIYFHENQFAYPKSQQQHASIDPQMVNLYSALSAHRVVFNSQFNQHSFLQGITDLFKRLPDHAPMEAVSSIQKKSQVLPVPIYSKHSQLCATFTPEETLKVIWNHRWEYDKGPDILARVIALSQQQALNISFTICGMPFRHIPNSFQSLQTQAPSNVIHMGRFESRDVYVSQLAQHHVVLSTAEHEFQGLAVLEGAAYGCIPLAPNRLAYPEWIPSSCLYDSGNTNEEASRICQRLHQWQSQGLPPSTDVCHYDWAVLIPAYEQLFNHVSTLKHGETNDTFL